MIKIRIIPGNGAGEISHCNWYGWLFKKIESMKKVDCVLKNMPDPLYARENIWLPFMKNSLKCDQNTIVIGHSSGSAAAMRYAESNKLYGIILVSAYKSDLGDDLERKSGYFDRPWKWDEINANCKFIEQFASLDDPFIPWEEQMEVAENLKTTLRRFENKGHFMNTQQNELFESVEQIILKQLKE